MNWSSPAIWTFPIATTALLGLLALVFQHHRVRRVCEGQFRQTTRERLFLATIGFFVAVLVVRAITTAIHMHIGPFHDVEMRGRHIHHLVWGILGLLLAGYLWLLNTGRRSWLARLTCLIYGVAAALTLDEFALWLNLRDVYWEREGRASFEAIGFFGGMLAVGLLGAPFFHAFVRDVFGRRTS